MAYTDLYRALFGKEKLKDGDVISFSEHGRSGGVSTGQGFRFSRDVDEQTLIDENSETVTYLGKSQMGTATSSSAWQIKRIMVSGSVTSIQYAGGSANYSFAWDDRSSLSYS